MDGTQITEQRRRIPSSKYWVLVFAVATLSCTAMGVGFFLGGRTQTPAVLPPISAATAAASDTLAVATGPISDNAEGVFFLDFLTGDLQCLVYYPRSGAFGARFVGNVRLNLGGGGKNAKYLLVTGQAITSATSGGARPGNSLVYVTDVNSGLFAAYAVPWERSSEAANRAQSGALVYVGGGPIRNYQLRDPRQNQPAAIVDPNQNP